MTCTFPRAKFRHKQEAWANYTGAIESKSEIALYYLKQRRYREARRYLEESASLTAWFDSLPNSAYELHSVSPTISAGGLPSGDKD